MKESTMSDYAKHVLEAGQTRVINLRRESEAVYLNDPMWAGEIKLQYDLIDFAFPIRLTALHELNGRWFATYYHPHDGRMVVELAEEKAQGLWEKAHD